ncbi:MAG: UDP-N-acetylglucosamine 2-epimerase (non-hydrolyzing) [Lentimicrobiaceae bacterium]|nr:UDP-N-acetylglucosamine 2-epimerase (non-hydrolyzing) [Lentimicrobiaceae bacterium]
MIKILTVIGARPQIIKAAALSRAIRTHFSERIIEIILHTGQHYDANMSDVFFNEMGIPQPDYNLEVGSMSHAKQTARMMEGIEEALLKEKPDFCILYGDTNSTLAGALAAAKIHTPVIHVEAGLRSFNKSMPEEINRICCDHVSTLLFSPTETGYNNLIKEGLPVDNRPPYSADNPKIYHCGDVMYDNSLYFAGIAEKKSTILQTYQLQPDNFILCTIHRDNNTDQLERLNTIFNAINKITRENCIQIILPLHPRTAKLLPINLHESLYNKISQNPYIHIVSPVSFLDMIVLEKNACLILTDSGGVQKEAYYFQKPCIILRPETEWKEIVKNGVAIVANADEGKILRAYEYFTEQKTLTFPPVFGDGKAAEFICNEILNCSTTPLTKLFQNN